MNGEQGTRTETEDKRLAPSDCTVHRVMLVSFTVVLIGRSVAFINQQCHLLFATKYYYHIEFLNISAVII